MIRKDPAARPSSAEALQKFKAIVANKRGSEVRWRLRIRNKTTLDRVVWDSRAVFEEAIFVTTRIFTFPSRLGRSILSYPLS